MADKDAALLRENQRLREALRQIRTKQEEIRQILDGVSDLLAADEEAAENTPVTDEDVKNLLKKYSRLSG